MWSTWSLKNSSSILNLSTRHETDGKNVATVSLKSQLPLVSQEVGNFHVLLSSTAYYEAKHVPF